MKPSKKSIFGVDFEIFLLGLVSFFTDISSEMIFSVLSIFITVVLGSSTFILGMIEGLADFSASSLDFVSGYFSDKSGKRKIFVLSGYSFSTLAKALLIFASTTFQVGLFRVIERLGKSFRGSPRDALISSISEESKLGFNFGFHKAMDKLGAVLGPLLAYFILAKLGQTAGTFKVLFVISFGFALLSVLILGIFVKDHPTKKTEIKSLLKNSLSPEFKHYLISASIFSLAYFSFAFLLLKAYNVGFEIKDVALLYALFNISFIIFAVPIGRLGDKIKRSKIIVLEYLVYAIMSVGFIFATTKIEVIILFLLYGIFYSIDSAQTKAYISNLSTRKTRATALGIYNLATGIVYLPASIIAGLLWKYLGPQYTFGFAASVSLIAMIFFISKKY